MDKGYLGQKLFGYRYLDPLNGASALNGKPVAQSIFFFFLVFYFRCRFCSLNNIFYILVFTVLQRFKPPSGGSSGFS